MPLKLPIPPKQYDIPALGKVVLKTLTSADFRLSVNKSQIAEEEERALIFASSLLKEIFIEPQLGEQEVENLTQEAKSALINLLVDELNLREEFDILVEVPSLEDRLYRAMILKNEKYYQKMRESLRETERRSNEIGPVLEAAKFWISPSIPMGLFSYLVQLYENKEATTDQIQEAFIDLFEQDDFRVLRSMVDSWASSPIIAKRMNIIRDALEAHMQRKYTLSVPALLPIIDGTLNEIRGRKTGERADNWIAGVLEDIQSDFMAASTKDALKAFLTGYTGFKSIPPEYFTPDRFPEWLDQNHFLASEILNRHAILHGIHIDYASKINSLRAFLILDVLANSSQEKEL